MRSCGGTRIAWYAPVVGLIKLRHQDQNDTVWCVHLIEHEGADVGYFPLDTGRTWRYRWTESFSDERFEDRCRVVSREHGTAWIRVGHRGRGADAGPAAR